MPGLLEGEHDDAYDAPAERDALQRDAATQQLSGRLGADRSVGRCHQPENTHGKSAESLSAERLAAKGGRALVERR